MKNIKYLIILHQKYQYFFLINFLFKLNKKLVPYGVDVIPVLNSNINCNPYLMSISISSLILKRNK